ncbi:hypothetical protein DRH27_03535 [Candidatus Falkowbacteria bacterium]|nr:MAG: hypothetical protein DRH27_03535 [Candidatus Falkowbacteria bacterium]
MAKYNYKNLLFILPIIFIVGIFLSVIFPRAAKPSLSKIQPTLVINNTMIKVEIADTAEKQRQGLSDRNFLDEMSGMLFVFPSLGARTFVMRRMNFPLDIIWIKDGIILKIDKNLPPEGENYINRYDSIYPVNYVLEVNGGFTDKYNIKTGDKIKFSS